MDMKDYIEGYKKWPKWKQEHLSEALANLIAIPLHYWFWRKLGATRLQAWALVSLSSTLNSGFLRMRSTLWKIHATRPPYTIRVRNIGT
jgi:hypothetical protein